MTAAATPIRAKLTVALVFAAEERAEGNYNTARLFAQIAAGTRQRDTYCAAEIAVLDRMARDAQETDR